MESPEPRLRSKVLRLIDRVSIVESWYRVFHVANKCVLLYRLQRHFKALEGNYGFVDLWVMARCVIAVISLFVSMAPGLHALEMPLILFGTYSVFEALVVQVNVMVFSGYGAGKKGIKHRVRSYRRLVLNSLHNYAEIIFWFALFYRNLDCAFTTGTLPLNSFWVSLSFSFYTMTTFGYADVSPSSSLGIALTIIQSAIGLLMVLVILSGFISLLPPPFTKDKPERAEHSALH